MRNLLSVIALSTVLIAGLSARNVAAQTATRSQSSATAQPSSGENQTDTASPAATQHQEATTTSLQSKSATGKITAVSGDTFAIEVGDGGSKETMQFVTDSNTAKSGDLKVGSEANVQYQSGSDGKNTATKVDIQG